jgi:hypothetical protein
MRCGPCVRRLQRQPLVIGWVSKVVDKVGLFCKGARRRDLTEVV